MLRRLAPQRQETKDREKIGRVDIKQATRIIQEVIQDTAEVGEENALQNKEILENAMAGVPGAGKRAVEVIHDELKRLGIEVEGMDLAHASYEIYKYAWGLGPIEDVYHDPSVNEIRVNASDQVYILRNLRNEKAKICFRDDEHVMKIITRITLHDRGVALNRSNPTIESMRKDGTRIAATCPPVTEHVTLVLRKPFSRVVTPDEFVKLGTLDEKTWLVLETLVAGRANVIIAGGTGSGKTTLLRTLFSATPSNARTMVLETDRELFLGKLFPDRDIIEMEEHPEAGRTLGGLFKIVLRFSPNLIIVGEFRAAGEAKEAVRACLRGHDGSLATAHFGTPRETIEGTGKLLLEEGMNLPLDVAVSLVASAYHVVVQMFGDSTRGMIKVESVTEVCPSVSGIEYRDLVRWVPKGDDYFEGDWKICASPSARLLERLKRYLPASRLGRLGW